MTLVSQVAQLQDSIAGYDAKNPIPWQIAQLVNSLVEQAKERLPDNPTLAVIEPFTQSSSGGRAYSGDIGSVRAILSQLYAVLPSDA